MNRSGLGRIGEIGNGYLRSRRKIRTVINRG